jgi:hypothetical protein
VHVVRTAEDAHVDVFACNVAKDDTGKNGLRSLVRTSSHV